jgi:hypothetical protein
VESAVEAVLSATKTFYHVTPLKNVPHILREGLVPKADKRGGGADAVPAIYLFNTQDDAEDGVVNWLADLYDEEEPLALLGVSIPEEWAEPDPELDLSASRVVRPIPPEHIKVLREDW